MFYYPSTKKPSLDEIIEMENPQFMLGNDNLPYAVFKNNDYSWDYAEYVFGEYTHSHSGGIASFGNYENAVCLQDTIGL